MSGEAVQKSEAINTIFGPADRDRDGNILSTYPAFYTRTQLEDLQESVASKRRALENDWVPEGAVLSHKEMLRKEEAKLASIEGSIPVLNESDRERLNASYKWLSAQIKPLLFSRSEMQKSDLGHEEARRMTTPCIKVENDEQAAILKACGVDRFHGNGLITREQATKAWKIIGRLIDKPSNVEYLRKD